MNYIEFEDSNIFPPKFKRKIQDNVDPEQLETDLQLQLLDQFDSFTDELNLGNVLLIYRSEQRLECS